MNTTKAFRLSSIMSEAKKYHRGCKDHAIYKCYRDKIDAIHLKDTEFIEAMKELTTILRV